MVLKARGPLGTSPIDGESKNIWTVLFSDFSTTEMPVQTHFSIQHKKFINPVRGLTRKSSGSQMPEDIRRMKKRNLKETEHICNDT